MKTNNTSPILAACLLAFLMCSGCLDIETTTHVNRDGSLVRTITFEGDSVEVYAGKFPVELDSTWTRAITKVAAKNRHYMLTASKRFSDVDEMNKVLGGQFGKTLQFKFEVEKSFQWFFTVYRYQETNIPFEQFTALPITDFLSQAEVDWLSTKVLDADPKKLTYTKGDSLAFESLEPRLREYELQNRFVPIFSAFLEGVKTVNDPRLPAATVEKMKDTLYRSSLQALDQRNVDTLSIIFARVLRSPAVTKAWQANASAFVEVKRRLEFEHETNSHTYQTSVFMPGLITGSNATKIEGNKATWSDFKDHGRTFGYTMWVESRQVNWWAVIIASVVVVVLVASLFLSLVRAKKRI